MKKRGNLALASFFIIVILVGGTLGSLKIISENRYIGDKTTKTYYDLKTCEIVELDVNKIINFKNLDEALESGYVPAECSKK